VLAGRVDESSVISGIDWLPTLCAIVGIKIHAADYDGEDVSAAWFGEQPHVRSKPLFWKTSSPGSESFIREGAWKLRQPNRKNDGEIELYDILNDPAESENLAAQHPAITAKLSEKAKAWVATLPTEYLKIKDKQD
jgi:N-acetylgalactosamine-6-sulfatase